jgi:hypothetical protein
MYATRHAVDRAKERLAPLLMDNIAAANLLLHLWQEATPATEAQLNQCAKVIDPRFNYRIAIYDGCRYMLVVDRSNQALITCYEFRGKL